MHPFCKDNEYSVADNFITSNVESCVEVNAHNMVLLIRQLRNINMPSLFLLNLINSQPCEEMFRHMRSMGSVNYTKINFTLLELFHLVSRIELQNDIIHSKLAYLGVTFPRNEGNKMSLCHGQLPSDEEIKAVMQKAREGASKDAFNLGMQVDATKIHSSKLNPVNIRMGTVVSGENEDEDEDLQWSECNNDFPSTFEYTSLPDFSNENQNNDNSGPYVNVSCSNGKTKTIRKSHLLWLLADSKQGLSSDRLKRVQGHDIKRSSTRQLQFKRTKPSEGIFENERIQVGDWCIFVNDDSRRCHSKLLFGSVLSFQYIEGKTWKYLKKIYLGFRFGKP